MAGQEDDWEYADEDGEDYSWEYEDDEEEAAPEIPKDVPKATPKEEPKPVPKEEPKEAPKVERRSRAAVQAEREKEEKPEPEPAPARMERADRNAIMEQMKRLQEGYDDIAVDSDISEYETSSEEEEEEGTKQKPQNKTVEEEEEDLSDLDLLDPFGSEAVPVIQKKVVPQNGHKKKEESNGEDKKQRKHRKKSSRHESTFEKFRKLEKKEKSEEGDDFRGKKIHVRSKDPSKIARQFEKSDKGKQGAGRGAPKAGSRAPVKAPVIEVNKLCKICGKEPYLVERLVAEKSWWHKNCFRCKECNKTLTLDTYASHQGVIYCKPHQRDLFKPKAVSTDLTEEITKKNIAFATYDVDGDIVERHKKQERRHETIVRESEPVQLKGVVKSQVDDSKWDGLDKLDVGSKFMMFEKAAEEKETRQASDRYGIMEKLKRLQAGEDVSDLLAEMDDDMPSDAEEEEEEDPEEYGLTEVQKKAHRSEKLFDVDAKKEKIAMQRKVELKKLRDKLMAGTRDNAVDSFDELNQRKVVKTKVDVRGANAKKFMDMFNNGEVPEGMSSSDRVTLEKDTELAQMRKNKRGERDFFKKMENGELEEDKPKEPKLLIGKLRDRDTWMENEEENSKDIKADLNMERMHAAKECKATSVLNKFKDMEKRIANGEDLDDEKPRNRPLPRRFTPPRDLGSESGSDYSESDYSYSSSDYSGSDSEDDYENGKDAEENEYLRNVREAARAKQLRAKFEEWEQGLGEDGGYTNLVDENGLPLETASKLKNRFENLAVAEPPPTLAPKKKYQVKRFKPKEAYEYQD